jgi:mRNA-binding protein PUF3
LDAEQADQSYLQLMKDSVGTHTVQNQIKSQDKGALASLLKELPGRVTELMKNMHAHHVLKIALEYLPMDSGLNKLIMKELRGQMKECAFHEFGCRVLQQLLAHGGHLQAALLADELLDVGKPLFVNKYGSHVADKIIEHGSDSQRKRLAALLDAHLPDIVRDRYGSHIVEHMLDAANPDTRGPLMQRLRDTEGLWTRTQYGRHVAKKMKQLTGDTQFSTRGAPRRRRSAQPHSEATS